MIRRGPKRSSRCPKGGEHTATVSAAKPNAAEIDSRLHPNVALSGLTKMLKVKTSRDPKLTMAPQYAAATTSQPCRGSSAGILLAAGPLTADIAVQRRALSSLAVGFFRKRVDP